MALAVSCAFAVGVLVKQAQRDARRLNACGRLCQMRLALQLYESEHGTLPPLSLRDESGNPIHSWRALILPYLEVNESLKRLDLSKPWNSEGNREIVRDASPLDWGYFARDRLLDNNPPTTHIFAVAGAHSIWEQETGLPKSTISESPEALMLISVPFSNTEPLQPGDFAEKELYRMVEEGHDVYFVLAGKGHCYGTVTIEHGKLAFHTWQDVLDRRDNTP